MSNPLAKKERSRAKDARQMPAPDVVPKRPPAKKKKPVQIQCRFRSYRNPKEWGQWKGWSRYASIDDAEKALRALQKKKAKHSDWIQFRIKP